MVAPTAYLTHTRLRCSPAIAEVQAYETDALGFVCRRRRDKNRTALIRAAPVFALPSRERGWDFGGRKHTAPETEGGPRRI